MVGRDSRIYLLTLAISIFLSIRGTISIEEMEYPVVYFGGYQNSDTGAWEKSGDFSNTITREGDDFSLIDSNAVTRILITCRASYPIYWEMGDVQATTLGKIFTHSKVIYEENGKDFNFQEFQSYLDLHNIPSLTGEYKCRSISNGERVNSIYVFLPGTKEGNKTFTLPTNETTVGLNGAEEVLILPCKVTRKEANVSLLLWEDDKWVTASLNAEFNPKRGFIVNLIGKQEEVVGRRFKCDTEEDALIVNVKEEYSVKTSFPYLNKIAGNATWNRRKVGVGVECCSNSSTPPKMVGAFCENQPHCEMVKKIFMNIPEPKSSSRTSNLLPTAKSTTHEQCVDSGTVLVKPFLLQCFGDGINLSAEIINELRPSGPGETKMNYVAAAPPKIYTYSSDNTIKFTTLQRVVEDDYEFAREFDMKRKPIYEGDRVILDCCGLVYHHALGRIQRIVWENGTLTRLPTPELHQNASEESYPDDHCFRYKYYGDEMENYFVTADAKMRYLECMVPVWNDVTPVIKRIELNIRTISPPVWTNNDTSINITYDENQVGLLMLDCGLESGDPPPKMTWMKDGQKILQTDKHTSLVKDRNPKKIQAHGTRLLFMRAAVAIQGEYNCSAENSAGRVEKLFYVEVKQRSYLDYWIALGVFGSFFIIIICCALRVSNLDKPSFSKKIEPEAKQEQKLECSSA